MLLMIKAVFLDRDGVINHDHGYTHRPEDFHFIDGVFDACRRFLALHYQIIVVTNQSGIGRGYYSEAQFHELSHWMKTQFAQQRVPVLDVFFCPHHPTKALEPYKQVCDCRKPAPGMIKQAAHKHNIDLSRSVMVGDNLSDMVAAQNAGITRRFLVGNKPGNTELPEGVEYAASLKDVVI